MEVDWCMFDKLEEKKMSFKAKIITPISIHL